MATNYSVDELSQCQLAKSVLTPYFKGIVVAECLVAPFVLGPNILLLSAVWHVTVFPSNLRLILGYFSFIFLLFSTTTIVKGLYVLISPPCAFNFSFRSCRIFDMATSSMVVPNIYFCLLSLCIERVYAALRFRRYDNNQKPWLGWFLIFCSWCIMVSIYGTDVWSLPDDRYVPICENSLMPSRSPYLMPGYMILECVTMLMTMFVYWYNRHISRNMAINRALYDLSARFLVDQNLQVNSIILPGQCLHFVAHLPMVSLLIPANMAGVLSPAAKSLILRSTYLWRLMYALADPLLAFYLNQHLRQHLEKGPFGRAMKLLGINIGKANKTNRATGASQAVAHFDFLDRAWSKDTGRSKHGNANTDAGKPKVVLENAFCEKKVYSFD